MGLIALWRRELMRASLATLLFPVALLGLALAVAGTGFGGLGSLHELVAGPDALQPAAVVGQRTARGPRAGLPAVPIATATVTRPGGAAAGGGAGSQGGSGAGGHRGGGQGGGSVGPRRGGSGAGGPQRPAGGGGAAGGGGGGGSGGGGSPSPGPGSSSAPAPLPSTAQTVQQAAGSLPGPAGPAASDAVGTVGQLVGGQRGR